MTSSSRARSVSSPSSPNRRARSPRQIPPQRIEQIPPRRRALPSRRRHRRAARPQRPDDVKHEDDFRFLERLEPAREHHDLNKHGRSNEKIITRQQSAFRIEEVRRDQQSKQQRPE